MASPTSNRCQITPPDQQPQLDNEENTYTHNFKGEFCRCGRTYDPETETEAMIQCIACEVCPPWIYITRIDGRIGTTRHASIYHLENSQKAMKKMTRLES